MDDTLKTILAIWGASLSTVLAVKSLISSVRDKPRIGVSADLTFVPCAENDDTKGTKYFTERGGWSEMRIELNVRNSGNKSLQIVSVYIEQVESTHQVFPENIPSILEPRTKLQTTIQKEWLDDANVQELGVLDALGKRHAIEYIGLQKLISRCNDLPSEKRRYKHKETGEEVIAWKVADRSSLHTRIE